MTNTTKNFKFKGMIIVNYNYGCSRVTNSLENVEHKQLLKIDVDVDIEPTNIEDGFCIKLTRGVVLSFYKNSVSIHGVSSHIWSKHKEWKSICEIIDNKVVLRGTITESLQIDSKDQY